MSNEILTVLIGVPATLFVVFLPVMTGNLIAKVVKYNHDKKEYKLLKNKACDDTCMCGDSMESHNHYYNEHTPVSQLEYAERYKPKFFKSDYISTYK